MPHEPPGVTVDGSTATNNPTSGLQSLGIAIVFVFPALALVVTCLRVYSRSKTKNFGLDDGLICVAILLSIFQTAAMYLYVRVNFVGIHIWDVPTHDPKPGRIINYSVQVVYNPILGLVNLNLLNIVLTTVIFFLVIFQCRPIAHNWDPTFHGGTCINQAIFVVSIPLLTVLTDLLVLTLPFWLLYDLNIATKLKAIVLGIFLLGGIVTVVGIVRFVILYRAYFTPRGHDPTYSIGFTIAAIESNLAIVCTSISPLRGLLRMWFPNFLTRQSNTHDPESTAVGTTGDSTKQSAPSMRQAGGAFTLKNYKGESTGRTYAQMSSSNASEEEIITFEGIMRMTDPSVRSGSGDKGSQGSDNGRTTWDSSIHKYSTDH